VSRPLVGLLIAVLATFVAAPSASLAASNTLSAATITPTSGPVGTVVTLAVTYDGSHPASAVTATVAGISLPLARVSGTTSSGRWSGTVTLPAGSWPVTFRAVTARGKAPTLDGFVIVISAAPAAPPAPRQAASDPPAPAPAPGGGTTTAAPPATPAPVPAVSPNSNPAELPTSEPQPSAAVTAAPTEGNGGALPSAPAALPSDPDTGFGGGAPGAVSGSSASQLAPTQRASASEPPTLATDSESADSWLMAMAVTLGITGACLLVIAFGGFLFGRRREPEEETAAEWPVQADDPIVAALGISPETALRARRARRLRDSLDERASRTANPPAAPPIGNPSRRGTRRGR
jgi:hypothetical protein